jgi:hypothetical protein
LEEVELKVLMQPFRKGVKMSRDYTNADATSDAKNIRNNAKNADFLRARIYSLQRVINNAQSCISGRGGPDDMDRYEEMQVAESNIALCQSLLSGL